MFEIYMHILGLCVGKQFFNALFTPESAVFLPAVCGGAEVPGNFVDPDIAGLNIPGELMGCPQLLGENAGGQAVLDTIRDGDCLVVGVKGHGNQDWTKHFLHG